MANIKAGDKVMITNVEGIMFGGDLWKDHEIVTVMEIEEDGDARLSVNEPDYDGRFIQVDGVPTFLVTTDEFVHLAKLLPVNATKEEAKEEDGN